LFFVEDETSQLVALAVGAAPGERVLDACAAPGGKTTAMAAHRNDAGLIVASDVRAKRVRLLNATVRNAGAKSIRVVQANAAERLPFGPVFDCVLIDAPCSGLGTLRRDPDIRWRRTGGEFPALMSLQLRILAAAAEVVRPGGRLVYSTCSSEPEENEDVISAFLASTPGWARRPVELKSSPQLVDEQGHLRTFPFRDRLEAFFAGQLVKEPNLR
jgi:16S rRNA (cytosine967-C5)-methyltransferase